MQSLETVQRSRHVEISILKTVIGVQRVINKQYQYIIRNLAVLGKVP